MKTDNESAVFDFQAAVKEVGYIKARQLLKQHGIESQQKKIKKLDNHGFVSRQPLRLAEAIKLSKTLGLPNSERPVEKILETASKKVTVEEGQSVKEANRDFDSEVSIRRSLSRDDGSLLLAQVGLDCLPTPLGDTLFLQTSFLKSMSIPRNLLISFLSHQLPQISMYNFRYMQQLNLSGNKIKFLPSDIGKMTMLKEFNLGYNALSRLPNSVSLLKSLVDLNLSNNNFSVLPFELRHLWQLERLHLSGNLFASIPSPVVAMRGLKLLDLSQNMLTHMGIFDPLLTNKDMWNETIDEQNGRMCFINVLTKEKIQKIELYDGRGIQNDPYLHTYQFADSDLIQYRRRKMWLSICQVYEWEVIRDPSTGSVFYQNNVSGTSQWEMPAELDSLSKCTTLEVLRLNYNVITAMADSICKMPSLKILSVHTNRIHTVPEDWSGLPNLQVLDLHNNEIKLLPPSLCDCTALTHLLVQGNSLVRLPALLGTMPCLAKIDCSANRLSQIPFSLGYSTSLVDLNVQENPLVDPPMEEVVKGADQLKWYLRNRLLLDQRGLPPAMEFHDMGIMHEITILKPEIREKIRYILQNSLESGIVNLQLMGLTDMPHELFKVKHIKRLQLDYNNHLQLTSGFPVELGTVKVLSVKSCRLPFLPANISNLFQLTQLNLEENMLESLPQEISTLTKLQILDLSKNRLHSLPAGLDSLVELKTLNLEGNRIEYLPVELGSITNLQTLGLARNRISVLPESYCNFVALKKLNVESNTLRNLPARISELSLTELRIGHNKIERLPHDLFEGALGAAIKLFSCCENNLTELPLSIHKIDPLGLLEADFNPMVSPPPYLLTEGLSTVQNYLRIRSIRMKEFIELLEDEDFEVLRENISPVASQILADGTGFLTPDDIADFDVATHEYLNGEYFKCPASGDEIVGKLAKLRDFRENDLYLTCLNSMINVLDRLCADTMRTQKGFGESVLITSKRPWGRKGENMNVWALCLHCLLKESPPNEFHRNVRPAVINLIRAELPEMAIPFTVDLLKDSIRLYSSPYGQVADTEQITFPSCDCMDEVRNKPLRHRVCDKSAVVLCHVIYSEEEAQRRDAEEDDLFTDFQEIEENVRIWLLTAEGRRGVDKEVRRRLNLCQAEAQLQGELMMSEEVKLLKAREWLVALQRRKKLMDAGESMASHGFENVQAAVNLIDDAEADIKNLEARIDLLKQLKNEMDVKLSQTTIERKRIACEDIVQKYCVIRYNVMVKKFRKIAAKHRLRRPWDGENGKDYKDWYLRMYGRSIEAAIREHGSGRHAELEDEQEVADEAAREMIEANKEAEEDVRQALKAAELEQARRQAEFAELLPEYDWEGTDDMSSFNVSTYSRYKFSKTALGQLKSAME